MISVEFPLAMSQLRGLFDPATLQRGQLYAAEGRVTAIEVSPDDDGMEIEATVAGQGGYYDVGILVIPARARGGSRGSQVRVHTDCSCPVQFGCKHAAAVLIDLSRGRASGPSTPAWQRELGGLLDDLEERTLPQVDQKALALQFDVRELTHRWGNAGVSRLVRLRPLQQGARDNWIKSGVSWRGLPYLHHQGRYVLAHVDALTELAAAASSYYYSDELRDLSDFGPALWPVLRRAQEAGVVFVPGPGVAEVELLEEPAAVTLDALRRPEGIELRPVARCGERTWPADQLVVVGKGHGLAVLEPAASGSEARRSRTADYRLVLGPLERPLPDAVARLLGRDHPIGVPEEDLPSFEADFLPRLRRQLSVGSSDGSVTVPEPARPVLLARVEWRGPGNADFGWAWRYDVGGRLLTYDFHSDDGRQAVRRWDDEQALVARLREELSDAARDQVFDSAGALVAWRALRDVRLLEFDTVVLPELRTLAESDGFALEETGARPDYRPAAGDPELRFDLAEAYPEGRPDTRPTDWLDLDVAIAVDGETLALPTVLEALTRGDSVLFLPSGLHVPTDHPALKQLAGLVADAARITDQPREGLRVGRYDLGMWAELAELGIVDAQAAAWVRNAVALRDLVELPEVDPPQVASELRSYQLTGFRWLAFLWSAGLGGILADDMGLGKTLQTLALVAHARRAGAAPFLVVAPTSVVGAWVEEATRHTPHLSVAAVGAVRSKRGCSLAELAEGADVVVTSYTLYRLEAEDYLALDWGGLVLDEAHHIKNHQSKTYQAVRRLDAPFRVALTGTPFENRLMELWSLLSVVAPGLYPWPGRFAEQVVKPVERLGDPEVLASFRRRIKPFLLRRTKDLVAADLPPKQEQVLHATLNPKHRRIYDTHLQRERQTILGLVEDFDANRIAIFRSLTKLRQLALDPALVDPEHDRVGSAKLDLLVEHLEEIVGEGHRALVFSQFTGYLGRVRSRLEAAGITTAYLDGRTRRRAEVIEGFRSGSDPVFLISLKAGGVGLTLTEADYVFVLDPWWNPATEAQAVDRAHRIGQTRPVMVYRLVATDTIEEKVVALKERKAALFASVVDSDGFLGGGIDASDVRALLDD